MSFSDLYPKKVGNNTIYHSAPEPLAALPYDLELEVKNKTLAAFLKSASLPAPQEVVPSPMPRHYRSTSKRRVTQKGSKVYLHMGRIPVKELVAPSLLEPEDHFQIYQTLQELFSIPRHRFAAASTNYCIIRGSGKERALILNVRTLSGDLVRSARAIAESAQKKHPHLCSAFLYVDETNSDYYLEAERPIGKMGWKKLFGPERLALQISAPDPQKFLYSPTVFSQINESILPDFAAALERELKIQETDQLLDLYCGYGLWSLLLAPKVQNIWGVELSPDAVKDARANAAYHYPNREMRFEAGFLNGEFLRRNAPPSCGKNEVILLDPPRNGALSGVLEHIIGRRPRKIAHVFCGVDEVPGALQICKANHCKIETIIPFDFFPGTLNLEILAILTPPPPRRK